MLLDLYHKHWTKVAVALALLAPWLGVWLIKCPHPHIIPMRPQPALESIQHQLSLCMIVAQECEVQKIQVDEQIQAIFNVTKEEICD